MEEFLTIFVRRCRNGRMIFWARNIEWLPTTFVLIIRFHLERYDEDAGRYVQHIFMEKRISLVQSFHTEVWKLFKKQLKNVRHSLLANFDKELGEVMWKEEFASLVSEAQVKYESHFREAAKKIVIDQAEWEWNDELKELRNGMTEKVKVRERDRAVHQARERERVAQEALERERARQQDNGISPAEIALGLLLFLL
jgi:hypothetical protein